MWMAITCQRLKPYDLIQHYPQNIIFFYSLRIFRAHLNWPTFTEPIDKNAFIHKLLAINKYPQISSQITCTFVIGLTIKYQNCIWVFGNSPEYMPDHIKLTSVSNFQGSLYSWAWNTKLVSISMFFSSPVYLRTSSLLCSCILSHSNQWRSHPSNQQ